MRTAISIAEPVFEAAEELAADLGMSRSQLYTEALQQFVERKRTSGLKAALDRVYGQQHSTLDPVLAEIQWASQTPGDW